MILTTITPYWSRPDQLKTWLACIAAARHPEVRHLLMACDTVRPSYAPLVPDNVDLVAAFRVGDESIGHYHNVGAGIATTEWIMKMDVDAMPNVEYFTALVEVLKNSLSWQWFNGGMFHVSKQASAMHLPAEPLSMSRYFWVMNNRSSCNAGSYLLPASSNFICNRKIYLELGGCDPRFKGWGWEDYQQLYMLERNYRKSDPLPGPISLTNVTQRVRDEISRPKAKELWQIDSRLCLLHRWHKGVEDPSYRSHQSNNRQVLFDYILKVRS